MRRMQMVVSACALGAASLGAVSSAGAQSAMSGRIKVWGYIDAASSANKPSPLVITGLFADHGTTVSVNRQNKLDESGSFVRVTLTRGGFLVNTAAFDAAFAKGAPKDFNPKDCSGSIAIGPAPVPIVAGTGTGAYQGITGSLNLSGHLALILPKKANGQCNMNANPAAGWGTVTGAGTVHLG